MEEEAWEPGVVLRLGRALCPISLSDNQALVERVMVCGCGWANVVETGHFLAQATARQKEGQEGDVVKLL